MSDTLIDIRRITKSFPGVVALENVQFDVERGELHAICGENGAGKSTLMKILSGVYTEYDGELWVKGTLARFRSTRDAERAGVSIIHQELNLVEELSAAGNIFLGRELRTRWGLLDERGMHRAAARLLDELECTFDPLTPVGQLRVGDQQLIEIAKALSLEADILIMDEPTSALTEAEVARLYRVIARLRARGVTILYISHKMDEVFRLADRITVLRDGRVVKTLPRSATGPNEITQLMVGRELAALDQATPRTLGDEVLRVERLSLPWPGHARQWRLQEISFSVRRGEIVGIAGLMGAGRTETLEAIFGARSERLSGRILLDGEEVRFRHPADAKAAGVAMVTEDRKRLGLFTEMSVGENITLCTLAQLRSVGLLSARHEHMAALTTIERLGIKTAGAAARITSLSGGNQQKCIIGRWLLTRPKLLLLDDPTRGIDVGAKAELYQLLQLLCREGLGIVITSSELPELLTVSDRILVLSEGRLTAEFSRSEATEHKILAAATG